MKCALILSAFLYLCTISSPVMAQDSAPVVTAPATASTAPNTLVIFTVFAADPDGDPIATLNAAPLPSGATFAVNATNASGTFQWTPTECGSVTVTFTAANALSGTASTVITAYCTDRAPTVTAPAAVSGMEGSPLSFTVTASDPDGEALTSLTAAGSAISAGGTFTRNAAITSGTFSWTPSFTQAGTYSVTFTASNSLSGSATTGIDIAAVDRAPVVIAPATRTGCETQLLTFVVLASDPDDEAIASLAATEFPPGATFTANATNTSGTFAWTPSFTQSGNHSVTFRALNALSGSATTLITVMNCHRPPVVTAPAAVTGTENSLITFTVTASDPDGEAITNLTASAMPTGATFTAGAGNTSGTFRWTPSFSQAGTYSVTFTASNILSGSATTSITVNDACGPPFITAPNSVTSPEGSPISFTVTAADPAGDPLTSLTAAPVPSGATFTTDASNTSGTFNWTPSFTQAGTHTVTFTVCGSCGCRSRTVVIVVTECNRTPVVVAPSNVSTEAGDPLSFNVAAATCGGGSLVLTASELPPGSTFFVSLDQTSGTFNWTPGPDQAGSWTVTFTATVDGTLAGSATTVIDVAAPLAARAFTTKSNRTIRLASGKSFWCSAVEPVGGSFGVTDIVLTSVVLKSPGTGSVSQIYANVEKTVVVGDADRNDVEDVTLCFRKEDLRLLFSNVSGKTTLDATLEGSLTTGRTFSATLSVDVFGSGGGLAASVAPNPLNPSGVLSFVSTRSGGASIRIFDQTGRLVRTLLEGTLPEGRHEIRVDGRDASGRQLATGIYFYRVKLVEGTVTGRFSILK